MQQDTFVSLLIARDNMRDAREELEQAKAYGCSADVVAEREQAYRRAHEVVLAKRAALS